MSYILDALKRADAERERGNVPGLRAQQVPLATPGPQGGGSALKLWLGVAVGAIVLLLAMLVWRMTMRGDPGEKAAAPQVAQTAPVAPGPPVARVAPAAPAISPAPAPVRAPQPPAPRVAQAPVVQAAAAQAPVAQTHSPSPAPAPVPSARAPVAAAPSAPSTPASATVAVAAPAKASASAPAEAAIPAFNDLPDSLKRQLPTLAISGSVYSDNPAQRLLTIGSQVFAEGDRPAPDLVLEQIRPKSAVFSFRGTRYSVAY
jgi:general secretion pathway protein B